MEGLEPYSPYLLLRYGCHLNVEICVSVESVKYLYKYVYKGPDRSMVALAVDDGSQARTRCGPYASGSYSCSASGRTTTFTIGASSPSMQAVACADAPPGAAGVDEEMATQYASSEVEYRLAWGQLLGEEGRGIVHMMRNLEIERL